MSSSFVSRVLNYVIPRRIKKIILPNEDVNSDQAVKQQVSNGMQNIKRKFKSFLIKLLLLWISICIALLIYSAIYYLTIPKVFQFIKVSFVKNNEGYHARIFNPKFTYPTCKNDILNTNLTDKDIGVAPHGHVIKRIETKYSPVKNEVTIIYDDYNIQKTINTDVLNVDAVDILEKDIVENLICINPLQKNLKNYEFGKEMYRMSLKFIIPPIDANYKVGSFPVTAQFINDKNNSLYTHSIGMVNPALPKYSMMNMMALVKSGLGFSPDDMLVDVVISEEFSNRLFNVSVINLHVSDKDLVFKFAYIELEAKLGIIRYLMYHWFWTFGAYTVISLGLIIFFIINKLWNNLGHTMKTSTSFLESLKNRVQRAIKKVNAKKQKLH